MVQQSTRGPPWPGLLVTCQLRWGWVTCSGRLLESLWAVKPPPPGSKVSVEPRGAEHRLQASRLLAALRFCVLAKDKEKEIENFGRRPKALRFFAGCPLEGSSMSRPDKCHRTRGQSRPVPRTRRCNVKQLGLETKILPGKENPCLQFPAPAS